MKANILKTISVLTETLKTKLTLRTSFGQTSGNEKAHFSSLFSSFFVRETLTLFGPHKAGFSAPLAIQTRTFPIEQPGSI